MKSCGAVLQHKVKLNFKDGKHYHKMRVTLKLEGKQEQIDLIKWQAAQLTDIENEWTTKFEVKVTEWLSNAFKIWRENISKQAVSISHQSKRLTRTDSSSNIAQSVP